MSRERPRRPAPVVRGASPRLLRLVEDGVVREADPGMPLEEIREFAASARNRMGFAVLLAPTAADVAEIAGAFDLHPLITEDLLSGRQRPKLARYDDSLLLVLRSARYIDDLEDVEFSEFHLVVTGRCLVLLCQDDRLLDGRRIDPASTPEELRTVDGSWLIGDAELLSLGPEAIMYRLLEAVIDGYAPVVAGIEIDVEQIERQVFSGDAAAAQRIYLLSQEVVDLVQASTATARALRDLEAGFEKHDVPASLQTYLQDLKSDLARTVEEVQNQRQTLAQILDVNATLVAQRQNEDMKKISGWAAILFAPTLIGAVYGMNFDEMPELHWSFGYPLAVGAMAALAVGLWVVFRKKKWM